MNQLNTNLTDCRHCSDEYNWTGECPTHKPLSKPQKDNNNMPTISDAFIKEWAKTKSGENAEVFTAITQLLLPGTDTEQAREAQEFYLRTVYGSRATVKAVLVPLLIPVLEEEEQPATPPAQAHLHIDRLIGEVVIINAADAADHPERAHRPSSTKPDRLDAVIQEALYTALSSALKAAGELQPEQSSATEGAR